MQAFVCFAAATAAQACTGANIEGIHSKDAKAQERRRDRPRHLTFQAQTNATEAQRMVKDP